MRLEKMNRNQNNIKKVWAAGFTLILGIGMGSILTSQKGPPQELLEDKLENEKNSILVYSSTESKVVNVSKTQMAQVGFFADEIQEIPAGTGSGFIWDDQGHIITNFHVVADASQLTVSFHEGHSYPAKIVGVEPKKDIAVLKIISKKEHALEGIPLGDSSKLLTGQKTMAIGSPFNLDQTFTEGSISAIGRAIPGAGGVTIKDMIQTDASINPGNSGGPLLNSKGQLIGMNTMIFSKSGSSAGIGFAVPVNTIKRVVDQIIRFGRVKQPGLGLSIMPPQITARLRIKGVLVQSIVKGSGADAGGLRGTIQSQKGEIRLGDVIVGIDGKEVSSYDDLYGALDGKEVGQKVKVTFIRENAKKDIEINLTDISAD